MSGVSVKSDLIKGNWSHSLTDPALEKMFKQYNETLLSCFGVNGSSVLIQNSVDRETLTSSSSTILSELQFSHPCLKFINSIIDVQNKTYFSFGSYIGLFCSGTLAKFFVLYNDGIHRSEVARITDYVLQNLLEHLDSNKNMFVYKLDIGNLKNILAFIKNQIFTKCNYTFSNSEKTHLITMAAKAFLHTIPNEIDSKTFGKVHIHPTKISSIDQALVFHGMIYPMPKFDHPKLFDKSIKLENDLKVLLFNVPLIFEPNANSNEHLQWLGRGNRNETFSGHLIKILKPFLLENQIRFLMNQKVIDPALIYEFEKCGIVVLERLGTSLTDCLVEISGCKPIGNLCNLETELSEATLGILHKIELINLEGKEFLLLSNENSLDVTLLIPDKDPHQELYLKTSLESCFVSLRLLVQNPEVVPGGGCLEAFLVFLLDRISCEQTTAITESLDTSANVVDRVTKVLKEVFVGLGIALSKTKSRESFYIDKVSWHLWLMEDLNIDVESNFTNVKDVLFNRELFHQPSKSNVNLSHMTCQCGLSSQFPLIDTKNTSFLKNINLLSDDDINLIKLDPYTSKLNAIRLACEGIINLLRISHCIFDK